MFNVSIYLCSFICSSLKFQHRLLIHKLDTPFNSPINTMRTIQMYMRFWVCDSPAIFDTYSSQSKLKILYDNKFIAIKDENKVVNGHGSCTKS